MRSGTSFFNLAVFKKTLMRFWPIWAANFAVWFIFFPLNALSTIQRGDGPESLRYLGAGLMNGEMIILILTGALGITTLAAMAVCSLLYSARSANFFGALPLRREGLFLSVYTAGLCMLIAPNVVIFLLMALIEAAGGALMLPPLLFWLGAVSAIELALYSFAVFCGMFTGHLRALPVFTGVFHVIAAAAYAVVLWIMENFYYGYTRAYGDTAEEVVKWLTPVWKLAEVQCRPDYGDFKHFYFKGGTALVVYAVAGLVFAAAALLLWRYRHLESAGDVVAVKVMRPVFRYGVAVCAGFLFGFLTALILGVHEVGLMIAIVIWGVIGCFVAQMLLDKSFKVFHKWKGSAAVAAAFVLLFLVVNLDLTGYESRVPDPARVERVEVNGLEVSPSDRGAWWHSVPVTDPENIQRVTALHKKAVEQRDDGDARIESDQYWNFHVVYHLKGGGVLARNYTLFGNERDLNTPDTVAYLVQQLTDDRALARQRYGFDEAEEMLAASGRLSFAQVQGVAPAAELEEDREGWYDYSPRFWGSNAVALWNAVLADFEAGTIGRHSAFGERNYGKGTQICFELEGDGPAAGTYPGSTGKWYSSIEICLPDTAVNTWAVLDSLGVARP